MSKADRDRQALLQRLAREQRRVLDAAARDADRARTPRTAPTPRRDDSPPSRTSEQPSAQSAARLKSLTPLYKQRQQRRLTVLIVIIIVLALALTVVTGTLSASLALLGDAVDSASLYLNRADGGWPTTTGITEPLEFTFIFVALPMYAVHCVLAGLSFMLMHILNVGVGMTFSGGLIDLFLRVIAA